MTSPWQVRWATLAATRRERDDVMTYEFTFDDGPFTYRPGQFNMLYLPGIGEAAISIASDAGENLTHTVKAVGNVTHAMEKLKFGDAIGVRGPYGTTWPMERFRGSDVVIAAGGLGLPPLRPAIRQLLRERSSYGRITLLYGAKTPSEIIYAGQFDAWRGGGIDVQVSVDRPDPAWSGHTGFLTAILERLPLEPATIALFTCGPEIMMRRLAEVARQRGIEDARIVVSLERNMSCAVGQCGHCQLGPEFVCKDGPVLGYDRVRKLLAVEHL